MMTRTLKITAPRLAVLCLAAGIAATGIAGAGIALAGPGDPLVYICPSTQGTTTNCTSKQELEVFDSLGAPIASIGEAGGLGVFGDNNSVFPPHSVFNPAVVTSYTSPAAYDKTFGLPATCTPPEAWFEPHGIWSCTAAGTWVQKIKL